MANRRFELFELRHIIVRMRLGDSDRDIKNAGLMGRRKASELRRQARERGWLDLEQPMPSDEEIAELQAQRCRKAQGSTILPYSELVQKWHEKGISGTSIYAKLRRDHGFTGSYESIKRFLRSIPKPPKSTVILSFKPGEAAQVDFGSGPKVLDPASGKVRGTWAFVMTLCYSRHQYIEFVFDQKIETWLRCHRNAFEFFGGVPRKIIIDNLKSGIVRACSFDPVAGRSYTEFAEGYGFVIAPCPPEDPQKKGIVESGVKFMKRGFVPLRDFRDIYDINEQAKSWCLSEAGNRIHGTTKERPLTLFVEIERDFLKKLPSLPPELSAWTKVKLHPDCHVTFEKCRYSAPARLIGKELWLRSTITMIELYHEHELVSSHSRMSTPGKVSTVQDHLPENAIAFFMRSPQWCIEQAEAIGPYCHALIENLLINNPIERLRAAQSIVGFKEKFGVERLEKACHRALDHGINTRKEIKRILEHGLDIDYGQAADDIEMPSIYDGRSQYCRDYKTLLN